MVFPENFIQPLSMKFFDTPELKETIHRISRIMMALKFKTKITTGKSIHFLFIYSKEYVYSSHKPVMTCSQCNQI